MNVLRQLITRSLAPRETGPEPAHGGVVLRLPAMEDFQQWSELRRQSRSFLEPWEPLWTEQEFTRTGFRARVRKAQQTLADDSGYHFLVFRQGNAQLLGGINLSHVRRGVAQMGTIGYWVGEPFARQGVMTDAVLALADYAFGDLGLHRLEAACIPTNAASISLLKRCHFVQEGQAAKYLKIAGKWQDHLLFSRTAP